LLNESAAIEVLSQFSELNQIVLRSRVPEVSSPAADTWYAARAGPARSEELVVSRVFAHLVIVNIKTKKLQTMCVKEGFDLTNGETTLLGGETADLDTRLLSRSPEGAVSLLIAKRRHWPGDHAAPGECPVGMRCIRVR